MRKICRIAVFATCAVLTGCGGTALNGLGAFIDAGANGDTFSPQTQMVAVGEIVHWTNKDTDNHTITVDTVAGGPDSSTAFPAGLATGDEYAWQVPLVASGTKYYYHCQFHGTAGNGAGFGTGMTGLIQVK